MKRTASMMIFATILVFADRLLAAPVPASLSHAVPAGLQSGESFQLLFVSRDVRAAQSSDIADYNEFVNSVADLSGIGPSTAGVEWFAVASTATVDARDNALVRSPVYNMQRELLASGFDDLWDGQLLRAVNYDERGVAITSFHFAWTGSRADGTAYPGRELGSLMTAEAGDLKLNERPWLEASNGLPSVPLHIYALSEPLQVVPEPAAWTVQLVLAVFLFAAVRTRCFR